MALFGSVQGLNIGLNLVRTKLVALFLGVPAGVGLSSIYNETKELIHESTNMGMTKAVYGKSLWHTKDGKKMVNVNH